jgi:serine phosphatase RsbU (regulator of sigma subunit)/PAS domain-containing protein
MAQRLDIASFRRELDHFQQRVTGLQNPDGDTPVQILESSLLELELAKEELYVCTEELQRQAEELASARAHPLTGAFTSQHAPFILLDRHGSILHANSAAGRLLGRPPGRLAGRPFALSVVQGSRRIFRGHLSAALRGGPVTASLPLQNGRLHTLTLWRDGDDVALLAAEGAESVTAAPVKAPPEKKPADGTRYRGTAAEAALRETARQLTGTLADCVIIDIADRDRPFRVVALLRSPADGPGGVGISELCDPQPWSLTQQIMLSGESLAESPILDRHGLSLVTGPLGTDWDAVGGSLLGVPLHRDGAVCGAITLVRGRTRPAFEQLDRMRLADLSDYLGFLIADLLRERHTTAAIETIRASLLPSALPKIPGVELSTCYQPAARDVGVGGDFYDLFTDGGPDGDCSWWAVVGDVCGKDDEAVSVTAMTRYGLRALSLDQASPAALLGRLNETMIRHDDSERFATAIVARLQLSDARLSVRLGSSGHPPAALLRADGSVGFCAGGGVPLGLFREAEQAEEQLWLSSGDCLLLYSDGVIEARDGTGQLFGEEGLALALREGDGSSAAAVVRSVRQAVAAFHGDRRLADDMVVLAIRAK